MRNNKLIVICDICGQGKTKDKMEVVRTRTYRMTGTRYYCKECIANIVTIEKRKEEWMENWMNGK